MELVLRPEVQRFIDEQVRTGRFPTPEAVVEAAIVDWGEIDDLALDGSDVAAINQAEAQADRGEGLDLDVFRAQITKRFTGT